MFSSCSPMHVFGTWAPGIALRRHLDLKDRQRSRQTKALTNRQLRLRQKWIGGQRLNNALACFSIFSHHDFSSGLLPEISASNWKLDNSIRRQLPSYLYSCIHHTQVEPASWDYGRTVKGGTRERTSSVTVYGNSETSMCLFAPMCRYFRRMSTINLSSLLSIFDYRSYVGIQSLIIIKYRRDTRDP